MSIIDIACKYLSDEFTLDEAVNEIIEEIQGEILNMPEEYNYFEVDEFTWDMIKVYLKHGFGNFKIYETTALNSCINDEIAIMTVAEFASKVERYDGTKWCEVDTVCPLCFDCPDNCSVKLTEEEKNKNEEV